MDQSWDADAFVKRLRNAIDLDANQLMLTFGWKPDYESFADKTGIRVNE